MALLSDIVQSAQTGTPDAGATKLATLFAGHGAADYTPGTTLAAGKYAVKCSAQSRGVLTFSGNGGNEVIMNNNLSGVSFRGQEKEAVIDLPQNATTLSAVFESWDRDPAPRRMPLPKFRPGETAYTGTVTVNTSNTLSLYGSSSMLASTPDGKVQVAVGGDGAQIWASRDYGNTWHQVGSYSNLGQGTFGGQGNTTYSVEYFNGRFIVGGWGYGMLSNNGFDWEYSGDGNLTTVRTADVSPTGYIFGRHSGSSNVGFSPDGQSFTLFSPSGLTGNVTLVKWDGTNYLAFDDGSRMCTSTDGINWNAAYSIPFIARGLQKLGSTWYAVSQAGQLYTSTNLTTWTTGSTLSSSTYYNHQLRKVGSTLVYYDPVNGQIKTSTDGVSWIVRADGLNQNGTLSVDALGKMWYRQNDSTTYYCSADNPIGWSRVIHPNQTTNIRSMCVGTGTAGLRWIAAMDSGYLMSSPDGFTWTERTSSFTGGNNFVGQNINTVKFLNNTFVAVGGAGTVAYSTDGDTWTRVAYNGGTSPINATNMRSISYGAGLWVLGNDNGYIYTASSLTGAWTANTGANNPFANNVGLYEMHFANNLFVAVGNSGWIQTSTDGLVWTKRSPLTTSAYSSGGTFNGQYVGDALYGVAYGTTTAYPSGVWVLAGNNGVTQYSTNGTDWRTGVKTSAIRQCGIINRVRYWNGRFWLFGSNGYLAWTIDGEDIWAVHSGMINQNIQDGAYDSTAGLAMAVGGNGQITYAHKQPGAATNDFNTWIFTQNFNSTYTDPGSTYTGAMVGGLYVFLNANGIWRTYDFMEFLPYVYNNIDQTSPLTDIVGGNGMFVARSSNNYCYFSPDGNRWTAIRKYSRNVENRCNAFALNFEDGYFWKYYNWSIQRSSDGRTWHTYYTFPYLATGVYETFPNNVMPDRLKKTGGFWFAWSTSTSVNTNFMYNPDLLRTPRNWKLGDLNAGSQGIYDIAGTKDFFVFNCTDVVRTSNTASGSDSYIVRNANSNSNLTTTFYKCWEIGGKVYTANGTIYEVFRDFGGSANTTASTVWFATALNTRQGNSNDNSYFAKKSGNVLITTAGNDPIIFDASVPATFSFYTSSATTIAK